MVGSMLMSPCLFTHAMTLEAHSSSKSCAEAHEAPTVKGGLTGCQQRFPFPGLECASCKAIGSWRVSRNARSHFSTGTTVVHKELCGWWWWGGEMNVKTRVCGCCLPEREDDAEKRK